MITLLLLLAINLASAQSKFIKLDEVMQNYHKEGIFNGVALIAENGKILLEKGYGYANLEWKVPFDADTKFLIGSVQKQFTAMAIMKLVESGKINLMGKVSDYLTDYRKDTGEKITIHHLLTHSSGLPWAINYNSFIHDTCSIDQLIKKVCSGNLEFEPGSKYKYSSAGYYLLMALLQKVSGIKYKDFLNKYIFEPAGIKNTCFESSGMIVNKRASGYRRKDAGTENVSFFNPNNWALSSSMFTTANDLFLWDQALYSNKLIASKYSNQIFDKQIKTDSSTPAYEEFYGYGWNIREYKNEKGFKKMIWHAGGDIGFSAIIIRLVEANKTIILLSNINMQNAQMNRMTESIEKILFEE